MMNDLEMNDKTRADLFVELHDQINQFLSNPDNRGDCSNGTVAGLYLALLALQARDKRGALRHVSNFLCVLRDAPINASKLTTFALSLIRLIDFASDSLDPVTYIYDDV